MLDLRQIDTSNNPRRVSVGLMIATALMWSLGGVLIKSVEWNPMAISGARSGIAAIVLLAAVRRPKFTWSFPQVGGAIAYVGTVSLFAIANKLTTAANSILLQYTSPIWIALLGAVFLGERATWADWLAITTVLAGMALFFADDLTQASLLGTIIAIASGFCFGCLTLFLRKQKDGSPVETAILGNILTALISIPFMLGSPPGSRGWLLLAVAGIFQLGLPYLLYTTAIKHITALDAILLATIEPILNPVWVLLAIGERPGPWALVGGTIVLLSVTVRSVVTAIGSDSVSACSAVAPISRDSASAHGTVPSVGNDYVSIRSAVAPIGSDSESVPGSLAPTYDNNEPDRPDCPGS
ncbi:MAG TPA: DMT family transporter [Firmicutes bacterium]|jgi:drug/metabolite transporter (DMT)-like permease|nr:DMT family transporter [Bacillota bacterium]